MEENKVTAETTETKEKEKDKVKALEAQVKALLAQTEQLAKALASVKSDDKSSTRDPDRVKIIHLVQRAPGLSTFIQLSNLTITMTDFGEERTLSLTQFEECVGKYRAWFNKGMITLAADYEDLAERYGISTSKSYPADSDFMKNLGNMSMDDIEKVYNRLPKAGQESVISQWMHGYAQKERGYMDARKIEALNRITDGAMDNLMAILNAERQKKSSSKKD